MASSAPFETAFRLKERLSALVGPEHARPGRPEDAIAGVAPQCVVAAGSGQEVASVLRFANEAQLAVIPMGGGTKLGWGNPPARADIVLSLARLNRVEEHAWGDLTVTVEAGCTIAALQRTLAEHRQRLAVDPLWPEQATVGGVLSANDSGSLRLSHCGLRDLIIGATLALADGTLAKSGGKVVKNVAGYDLSKMATGSLGTLGIITRAIFRVHPLPAGARTLSFPTANIEEMQRVMLELTGSTLAYTALQARLAWDQAPVIDIGIEGSEVGLAAQEHRVQDLAGAASESSSEVWNARQDLWTPPDASAIAKLSIVPSEMGKTLTTLTQLAKARNARWRAAMQATGIGWLRIDAGPEDSMAILLALRAEVEGEGGSLVLICAPEARTQARIDAWGGVGDTLPLMRALKQQFDPQATLNPGRYVGGI